MFPGPVPGVFIISRASLPDVTHFLINPNKTTATTTAAPANKSPLLLLEGFAPAHGAQAAKLEVNGNVQ